MDSSTTSEVGTSAAQVSKTTHSRRRRRIVLLSLVAIIVVAVVSSWWWSVCSGLDDGRRLVSQRKWRPAQARLERYLHWHSEDAEARLLLAEALVKNNDADTKRSVNLAIKHLSRVPDSSPHAATARIQEARLTFLILKQPKRSEELLRAALKLQPVSLEASLLLWKLLDLTGRHIISRKYFWQVYEQTPVSERPLRLRDWFLAEFYPEIANAEFHRAIDARAVGKIPASVSALVILRESEPSAPFLHAALAAYYLERGRPKSSLELLKEAPDLASAMADPFFSSTLFETLVALGETSKAAECFKELTRDESDYLYWRSAGMFHQHVSNNPREAVRNYQKALSTWPARFDWGMMMKLSECLRKVGSSDEAQTIQDRVKHLTTKVLTKENTSDLRARLHNLHDAALAEALSKLYTDFGLNREAEAWQEHLQNLAGTAAHLLPSSDAVQ